MKKKNRTIGELPILIVVILPLLLAIFVKDQMSGSANLIPGSDNRIPAWSFFWILSGLHIFIYLLLMLVQEIDPFKKNYQAFKTSFYRIRFMVSLFMTTLVGLYIASNTGIAINTGMIIRISAYVLMAIIGNYVHSIKPNWFIGFRTPWTMDNETVWRRTHIVGSKIMVGFSITGLVTAPFPQKEKTGLIIFLTIVAIIILVPVIYSYRLYRQQGSARTVNPGDGSSPKLPSDQA